MGFLDILIVCKEYQFHCTIKSQFSRREHCQLNESLFCTTWTQMMGKQRNWNFQDFCLETTKLKTIIRLKVIIPKKLYSYLQLSWGCDSDKLSQCLIMGQSNAVPFSTSSRIERKQSKISPKSLVHFVSPLSLRVLRYSMHYCIVMSLSSIANILSTSHSLSDYG